MKNKIDSLISIIFIVVLLTVAVFTPGLMHTKNIGLFFLLAVFLSACGKIIKNISYLDLALLAFMGMVSLSLLMAQDAEIALKRYLTTYLPLVFIYLISKNLYKESYVLLARSLFFLGASVSIFIIFEFFTGKNFIYEYINHSYYFGKELYKHRAFGTFPHPTIAGNFLTACLPFAWIYLSDKSNRIGLITGSVIFIFMSIAIVVTFSKMALIVMLLIYLWLARRKDKYINGLLVVTFFILATVIFFKTAVFMEKLSPSSSVTAVSYRLKSFITVLKMIAVHPFIGVGLDHFRLLFSYYATDGEMVPYVLRIPDDMYLMILVETGVVGFILFGTFICMLINRALTTLKKMTAGLEKVLFSATMVSFAGMLIHNFSYDSFCWPSSIIVFWILVGMVGYYSQERKIFIAPIRDKKSLFS